MKTFEELFYSVDDKNDTTYHLQYDNAEYSTIDSYEWIEFAEEGNTLNDLYNALKDCFDKDENYQTSFKLGKDLVVIKVQKSWGVKYLFISPPKGYFMLTKKELMKLFNRQ